jgi:ABC-type proline/glycine betaine transport system ATPase subunit
MDKTLLIDDLPEKNTEKLISIIENTIIHTIMAKNKFYIIHAGVLLLNDAILICGKSGSGKSTSCFLLDHLYKYKCLTDDIAFIDEGNFAVQCISMPIILREDAVQKYSLFNDALFVDYDKNNMKRYIIKSNIAPVNLNVSKNVCLIVDLQYSSTEKQSCTRITGDEAIKTILFNSYTQDKIYDHYITMINLLKRVNVIRVIYNDTDFLDNAILNNRRL